MPFVGFLVFQGKLNLFLAILANVAGCLIGALPWYLGGRFLGEAGLKRLSQRHHKWFKISPKKLEAAKEWFQQHGGRALIFCRPFPGVRTLIAVPAGMSGMLFLPFLLYVGLGAMLWSSILTATGYALGTRYYLVKNYLSSIPHVGLAIVVGLGVFWIGKKILRSSRSQVD